MKVSAVPIDSVKPYPGNPRQNADAVAKVAASLKEFGWRQPIVVDAKMVVIAGHTRLLAARSLGMGEVPVHVAAGLTAAQVRAYRLADNRTAQEATWDDELLVAELRALQGEGYELGVTGFDARDLERRIVAEVVGSDNGEVPEPPEKATTALGDLFRLDEHVLVCGDATDPDVVKRALAGRHADCVFTDPPYAVYGSSTGVAADIMDDKMVRPFFRDVVRATVSSLKLFGHAYICCDWRSWASWWEVAKGTGFVPKNMIVWDKGGAGLGSNYANAHELLMFGSRVPMQQNMRTKLTGIRSVNGSNIWRLNRVKAAGTEDGREHNAQKPVEMVRIALEHSTDSGDMVIDFFGGSGTTLIAAEATGRVTAMIEVDPRYCDVIVKRWENATGKKAKRKAG